MKQTSIAPFARLHWDANRHWGLYTYTKEWFGGPSFYNAASVKQRKDMNVLWVCSMWSSHSFLKSLYEKLGAFLAPLLRACVAGSVDAQQTVFKPEGDTNSIFKGACGFNVTNSYLPSRRRSFCDCIIYVWAKKIKCFYVVVKMKRVKQVKRKMMSSFLIVVEWAGSAWRRQLMWRQSTDIQFPKGNICTIQIIMMQMIRRALSRPWNMNMSAGSVVFPKTTGGFFFFKSEQQLG